MDIGECLKLLDQGIPLVNSPSDFSVLLLGSSGSGKTSLLNYLSGRLLIGTESSQGKPIIAIEDQSDQKYPIRNDPTLLTLFPQVWRDGNINYWDFPGFEKNQSIGTQIAHSYFMKRIFDLSKNIKIVLVIEEHINEDAKCVEIVNLFKKLIELIPDKLKLFSVTSIIITKCSSNIDLINYKNLYIEKIKNFEEIKQFMLNIFNSPEKFCIFSTPALNEHLSLDFKK